jgi:hypothetical protein
MVDALRLSILPPTHSISPRAAKISLAHAQGSKTLACGGTLKSNVDVTGQCLLDYALRTGFGTKTPIHGVGDGAPWIADQMKKKIGVQGSYLIDFYHACDYLRAAGKAIHNEEQARIIWIDEQKIRLKTDQAHAVLQELQTHLESSMATDSETPVKQCYRYLNNRLKQLNYQDAIKHGLPIGSGKIESAHLSIWRRGR